MKKAEVKVPTKEELEASLEDKKIEYGYLGKFFGGSGVSKTNIAGLILIISLVFLIFYSLFNTDKVFDLWKTIITLTLGYIVGKADK